MESSEDVNLEELRVNLNEYQQQLEQVEQLLLDDPGNEEYKGIYDSLAEVIQLTKDLLGEAGVGGQQQDSHAAAQPVLPGTASAPPAGGAAGAPAGAGPSHPVAAITAAPDLRLPSVLPPQVALQIRQAQQRAAMAGQAPPSWAIGAKCQAVYSDDGQWYNGTIEAVSVSGNFIVAFDGYESKEEVQPGSVRPRAEEEDEGGYKDDEKTKQKKKKLQKSYKSKLRFHKMDQATKGKAEAWRNFVSGKGSKKKAGFLTGYKKESMFKVPEGVKAKVGVIGSGQGMTEYQQRKRHDFAGLDE
ncbi:hypothetical protein N2152v2_000674 [Parachlorella kessleri]